MKPVKIESPAYTRTRRYHQWYDVPGNGLCPKCGQFARVQHTETAEFKTQYRKCDCGNTFTSVAKMD